MVSRALAAAIATAVLGLVCAGQPDREMRQHDTRYYVVHTDLDSDRVREVDQRVTTMAEEYRRRTKGFAGKITKKLPFYLFSTREAYYAAGGRQGSAGLFDGRRLMAVAGQNSTGTTWRVIQHEGFHQFVRAVIGGDISIWVNEGLAEYFGEAIFTGDGYVTGVIPPRRLARLQKWINAGQAVSIAQMMQMTPRSWLENMTIVNYDQAWSMVHFLAHANDGKYEKALSAFLRQVSRGAKWEQAWARSFGAGTEKFEERWREYWRDMRADAAADLYAKAAVASLTSFYARAVAQKQTFGSWDEFRKAARDGALKHHPRDWLPPSLLHAALAASGQMGQWQVRKRPEPALVCVRPNGVRLTGTFKVARGRVRPGSVKVSIRAAGK